MNSKEFATSAVTWRAEGQPKVRSVWTRARRFGWIAFFLYVLKGLVWVVLITQFAGR